MTERDDKNRDEIREQLNADTTHAQARAAIEAVLDLHHEYKRSCYECSRRAAAGIWPGVTWPCLTVKEIRRAVGIDGT